MTGWECPRCGRCYGPLVQECHYCQPRTVTTSGTATYPACTHSNVEIFTGGWRCRDCGYAWAVKP